ncbi:hypothetical protein WQ54_26465 [Bacillus sp. SA1-12]|uniref:hypothetical protein n=1 Tax=Bacillus sp. SA1-12 TaxID=1455638 RepID=UPI0006273039|nr:hypothetical protein [Bacillus sp. SA1-12]KKI89413.1 hypothetical protein WQ54_26465 [Bacillus sp. SA1-12]
MDYKQYWKSIAEKNHELNSLLASYWNDYSHMGTWQFWVVIALLIIPLVLLYFTVDRRRIFEVFFFGYTVHILWTYLDLALEKYHFFNHTYFLTPVLPFALNMNASVLPVGFLLIYQYCTNNNKNFYLYSILISVIFAFGFASLEEYVGLVNFSKGMNKFYLFVLDMGIIVISYWLTKLMLKIKRD